MCMHRVLWMFTRHCTHTKCNSAVDVVSLNSKITKDSNNGATLPNLSRFYPRRRLASADLAAVERCKLRPSGSVQGLSSSEDC